MSCFVLSTLDVHIVCWHCVLYVLYCSVSLLSALITVCLSLKWRLIVSDNVNAFAFIVSK